MIDYRKKAKEHLFLSFLLGGLFGIIDNMKFELGNFIGSGLAIMCFSLLIGSGIHYVLKRMKIIEYKSFENDEVLDSDINNEKLVAAENKIHNYLDKFKFSVYVALFFVIVAIIDKIS